jgi:hypothetical protein
MIHAVFFILSLSIFTEGSAPRLSARKKSAMDHSAFVGSSAISCLFLTVNGGERLVDSGAAVPR